MPDATSAPPREIAYPIEYHVFTAATSNRDFKGRGMLTIQPTGPVYIFSGRSRKLFARKAITLTIEAPEISNVTVEGRMIRFNLAQNETRRKDAPFVFFCRDEAEARSVAILLPTRVDTDLVEARDFLARLEALNESRRAWSSVTNLIIALNVLSFVVMGLLGAGWFETDSFLPYILYGANNGAATTDGEWWRLLTSMFMHYGILHLLFNMWALFQAGHFLEKLLGRWLYALTYLGSGLAGGFTSIAWHGDKVWSAGASGAVFGVYGAILGYMLREKQSLPSGIYKPMMKSTLIFAGYNIIYGLRAGVDNSAHVGGMLGGLVLGWLLALPVDREVRTSLTGERLQLGLTALGVMLIAGVLLTPRFDYRIREELAWSAATKEYEAKETDLIERQEKAVASLNNNNEETVHAEWMETNLVPFYENWDRVIAELDLTPGRRTEKRRTLVTRILHMRIESYRHLITGLRAHDKQALSQYTTESVLVSNEINKLRLE
jgi:rhomboid protease GluP